MSFIKKLLNEFSPAKTLLKKPTKRGPGVATRTVRGAITLGVGTKFARRAITKRGIPVSKPSKPSKPSGAGKKKPAASTLTPSQTKKKAGADEFAGASPEGRGKIAAEHPNRARAARELAADLRRPSTTTPTKKKKTRAPENDDDYRKAARMELERHTPSPKQKEALGKLKVRRLGPGAGELVKR